MTYFFVEGHLEKQFISNVCGKIPVKRIDLNGNAVAIPQVVRRIVSIYRAIGKDIDPIIVIFDREQRVETSEAIAAQVVDLLAAEGIKAIVGIPDRCIETWMLFDSDVIAGCEGNHEGTMGTTAVKGSIGKYSKAVDGPKILKKCKASALRQSPSFKAFADALDWMNCWWLKK